MMEQNVQKSQAGLSKLLQKTMLNEHAYLMAIEEGYIVPTPDGHLQWMLGSKTLLAYFCGRLWCGDYGQYIKRCQVTLWQCGKGTFPENDLRVAFGMEWLRNLRNNKINFPLPQNFQLIDNLFTAM